MLVTAQRNFKTVNEAALFVLQNRNRSTRLKTDTLSYPADIPVKRAAVVRDGDSELAYIDTGSVVYETTAKMVVSTIETSYEYGLDVHGLHLTTREFSSNGKRYLTLACELTDASANA